MTSRQVGIAMGPGSEARADHRVGFSMAEFTLSTCVLLVLVGIVGTRSSGRAEDGPGEDRRVQAVLALVEDLQDACAGYHADTGGLAHEYTGYGRKDRQLTLRQGASGWDGPYLQVPLVHGVSNPFGSLHLYARTRDAGWIPGFDLDGDGRLEVGGTANVLWLAGVDEASARRLDSLLESGSPGPWRHHGRLRYDLAGGCCWILIHH